ncbi:MAG: ribose-phosphate diphosphokinase [Acidimicrobiia bacterium]|nr:ribose-phosphate diphosphokinase [Acidimicrobiia bacterium]
MKIASSKRLMLFSGSANLPLASDVAEILGEPLGDVELSSFANGEIYVRYNDSVRGADCFVLQSHSSPVNFHIMEQLIMIDALQRASAKRITAVVPFFGYARQDKKVRAREPISARLLADMFLAAGADRIVSVDLHTGQIQGFTSTPFDHLTALHGFADYLTGTMVQGETVIVSPDSGRVKLAEKYAKHLGAEMALIYKRRRTDLRNEVEALWVVGEVEDKHAVIVDDMVDTAGTLISAAKLLKARGALTVRAVATHGVLSNPAVDRIKNSSLEELIITNSLPLPPAAEGLPNLSVLSIAPQLAQAIEAIFNDASVSSLFRGENF